jgi:hypothetical protein
MMVIFAAALVGGMPTSAARPISSTTIAMIGYADFAHAAAEAELRREAL